MPSLFSGVENFTPAFTGQQIAIGAGQGAGQSISRGMRVAQQGKQMDFEKFKYEDTLKQLRLHDRALGGALGSVMGPGDWAGETDTPTAWQ